MRFQQIPIAKSPRLSPRKANVFTFISIFSILLNRLSSAPKSQLYFKQTPPKAPLFLASFSTLSHLRPKPPRTKSPRTTPSPPRAKSPCAQSSPHQSASSKSTLRPTFSAPSRFSRQAFIPCQPRQVKAATPPRMYQARSINSPLSPSRSINPPLPPSRSINPPLPPSVASKIRRSAACRCPRPNPPILRPLHRLCPTVTAPSLHVSYVQIHPSRQANRISSHSTTPSPALKNLSLNRVF